MILSVPSLNIFPPESCTPASLMQECLPVAALVKHDVSAVFQRCSLDARSIIALLQRFRSSTAIDVAHVIETASSAAPSGHALLISPSHAKALAGVEIIREKLLELQVAEEELVVRVPLRLFTPVICYDISVVKSTILKGLRKVRSALLEYAVSTLHRLCAGTLADVNAKLRWLVQVPQTPHELHDRQTFCDSLADLLSSHKQFVHAAEVHADLLQQFDCVMDGETSSSFYNSIYLPKMIVQTVDEQQPLLQQLLRKFVQEHQQELAGFLADLQQTASDIRLFHSYSDIDNTDAYSLRTPPPLLLSLLHSSRFFLQLR